jgi:hypothetical protein
MGMPANPYRDRLADVQSNSQIQVYNLQKLKSYLIKVAAVILRRRIKIKKTEVFQTLTEILTAIACQATNLNMAAEAALACNNLDMAEGWV